MTPAPVILRSAEESQGILHCVQDDKGILRCAQDDTHNSFAYNRAMSFTPPPNVQEILQNLPTKPGVYLHKDKYGKVIYVGKAINLRSRVRSYFHKKVDSIKTQRLRREITDIEIITTDSELEALLLEKTLIKKHQPRYNIRLKDDKRYPYIKVHWADDYPKGDRHAAHGARRLALFWPLHLRLGGAPDAGSAAQNLPLPDLRPHDHRPGLRAPASITTSSCAMAPASARSIAKQYRAMIQQLMDFLNGKSDHIMKQLEARMMQRRREYAV